jgi:SAM-dependent methyltransferase
MTTAERIKTKARQAFITARPWSKESIEIRNRNQAAMLSDRVKPGETVLDVGCGTAYLTKTVQEVLGAEVTGLDVQDFRAVEVPFKEFDGLTIPFPDQSFDHVILSFTLHHCQDPLLMIQECRRVARRSIMAFEDLPSGRFGEILVKLHVESFRRQFKLEHKGGDYRGALAWLREQAPKVVQVPLPYEWFDHLYVPRHLLTFHLAD